MARKHEIAYVSDHSSVVLQAHSWRTAANSIPYLLPRLTPAMRILDVGCGPGTITADLARLVPEGHVTGVEYTAEPLEQARAFAASQGVGNIEFRVGDIHELPFADETFDVVHAHQVLQHVRDPVAGLREMRRVVKKGGLVAVRESAAMTWFPETRGLEKYRDVWDRVSRAKGGNPHPGRMIHVWARKAGFRDGDVKRSAGTWCWSSREERESWGRPNAERLVNSSFAGFAVEGGHATREDLEEISQAWLDWVHDDDGWLGILHGEIICQV